MEKQIATVQIKYGTYQGVEYVTCNENDENELIIAKARKQAKCDFLPMAYFSAKILKRAALMLIFCLSYMLSQAQDRSYKDWYTSLEISYVTLNAIDYGLTVNAINQSEIVDLNPIFHFTDDPYILAANKVVWTAGFLLVTRYYIRPRHEKAAMWTLIAGNAVYGAVVAHQVSFTVRFNLN